VKERRKLERYQLRVPTTIELADESGHLETLRLETKDISADGAYLTAPGSIAEGTHVKLEMVLSVERLKDLIGAKKKIELRMEGKVIRKEPTGIAVLFEKKYQINALNHHSSD
jgi:c-di-GMP-binding flagellar brake protein YcgR